MSCAGRLWTLVLLSLLAVPSHLGLAQVSDIGKALLKRAQTAPLRGLKGVMVVVEMLPDAFKRGGITEEQLETDAQLRLRTAGINVLDWGAAAGSPDFHPQLYIYSNAMKIETMPAYAVSIVVSVNETVTLARDPTNKTLARTWSKTMIATIGELRMREGVKQVVSDLVDVFSNDYLAANPR